METDGADEAAEPGRDVELLFPRGGYVGGGSVGGGDLCHLPSEHLNIIYCNKENYGPLFGVGVEPCRLGIKAVVGKGGTRYRGDTGGGLGGGGRNRLGGSGVT